MRIGGFEIQMSVNQPRRAADEFFECRAIASCAAHHQALIGLRRQSFAPARDETLFGRARRAKVQD
jgi:hypothetical protein